jgi:hypothetical protein
MAFNDTAIVMLRVIISDLGETPTYSDSRLEETLIVAAHLVQTDIGTDNYTINVPALTLSPDPALTASRDDAFLNLVVLKSACFIDFATYRTKAVLEGVRATLGPANIGISGNLKGFQVLLESAGSACKLYERMLNNYLFGDGIVVRAILSPFSSPNFDPGIYRDMYYKIHRQGY